MQWIKWAVLPLPLLSLITLVFALTRRNADPKVRWLMVGVSAAALVLGVLMFVLVAQRVGA